MLPIVYSTVAMKLDAMIRSGEFGEKPPPCRSLAKRCGCSVQALERALEPFKRSGVLKQKNARVTVIDYSCLPSYSIAVVGDFRPSPFYDDSCCHEMFSVIKDHGGESILLSVVGGRVNAGQFKSFTGYDGIVFTQLTHLNPEFSDFLTNLNIPFASIGAPAGCSVRDYIDHGTFEAQSVLLRRLVRAGYRRIELWHPAVVPGEWERRKKRWRILKRSLGLPLLSGDEALYD